MMLAACNKSPAPTADTKTPAEKPVATVNGVPISRAMFDYYIKNTAGKAATELTPDQRAQLLDNLIRGEVIAQQAEKEGLDKTGDTASLLALSHLQILEQAGAEKYLKDKKPTDAERQAEYDAQVAAMPKTQYHARHILVATQDAAQKVIDQLKKGAKFEDLAAKNTKDTGTKERGGDLDWNVPGVFDPQFSQAMVKLDKGQVSDVPVHTRFGYHVIRLDDVRAVKFPELAEIKPRIQQQLMQHKVDEAVRGLRAKAKVE
jgi:peptidyl-prolyl cis-trans isomerase C